MSHLCQRAQSSNRLCWLKPRTTSSQSINSMVARKTSLNYLISSELKSRCRLIRSKPVHPSVLPKDLRSLLNEQFHSMVRCSNQQTSLKQDQTKSRDNGRMKWSQYNSAPFPSIETAVAASPAKLARPARTPPLALKGKILSHHRKGSISKKSESIKTMIFCFGRQLCSVRNWMSLS